MPRIRLNKSNVDKIPFSVGKQILYCDDTLKGFYLVVSPQRKTYVAQRDIQGKTTRYTIGNHGIFTPDKARKICQEKLMLMAQGINPKKLEEKEKFEQTTLQELLDNCLLVRRNNLKESTKREYRFNIERYLKDWLSTPVTDIDKQMVLKRHALLSKKSGSYTANGVMRILRALFNHAHTTYDICETNPVNYLTKAKAWNKETRRRRYIKPHELKTWWEANENLENDTMRDFLKLLLMTGLRRNEAATLCWENIDFQESTLCVQDTKNGEELTLPLSNSLKKTLRRRYTNAESRYVFPGNGAGGHIIEPRKAINAIYKETGIEFSCHDLRRTFITIAESLDIPHYALKRLVNHKNDDVTSGYIVSGVERLRKPVEKIEKYIKEKVSC